MKFPCPPGCVDHYTVEDTRNHETMPRAVTGADVYTGMPMEVCVWLEQRDNHEGWELVGVLEKPAGHDVEFSSFQLRELAYHMTEVADQMDAIAADRKVVRNTAGRFVGGHDGMARPVTVAVTVAVAEGGHAS